MSVRFDGSTDRLTYTHTDVGPFGGAGARYTLMAWVRFAVSPSAYSVFFSLDRAADYHTFGTTSTGLVHSCQRGSGSETDFSTTFVVGRWYHVAYVRPGGTTVFAFVNGVRDGSAVMDNSVPTSIILGSDHDNEFLNGNIQHVRIYKREMTSVEIVREMQSSRPVSRKRLFAAWNLSGPLDLVGLRGRTLVVAGTPVLEAHVPLAGPRKTYMAAVVKVPAAGGASAITAIQHSYRQRRGA